MPQAAVNYIAVLASAVASMIIGSVWYSPSLFGKRWVELMKWDQAEIEKRKKTAGQAYIWTFIGALVTAYVLAVFIDYSVALTAREGAVTGLWAWLGFVGATGLSTTLFESRPKGLYYINTGLALVNFAVMGAILAVWR